MILIHLIHFKYSISAISKSEKEKEKEKKKEKFIYFQGERGWNFGDKVIRKISRIMGWWFAAGFWQLPIGFLPDVESLGLSREAHDLYLESSWGF